MNEFLVGLDPDHKFLDQKSNEQQFDQSYPRVSVEFKIILDLLV